MITIIGILVGVIIVALIWMFVYFNQEIHDVMSEMRARAGGYYHTPYKVNYSERYADVLSERDEYKNRYDSLKKSYGECLKRCAELERELDRRWDLDEMPEDDDELDN